MAVKMQVCENVIAKLLGKYMLERKVPVCRQHAICSRDVQSIRLCPEL